MCVDFSSESAATSTHRQRRANAFSPRKLSLPTLMSAPVKSPWRSAGAIFTILAGCGLNNIALEFVISCVARPNGQPSAARGAHR